MRLILFLILVLTLHYYSLSCANPSYTVDELVHQLRLTNALVVFSSPDSVDTALAAARQCGIPADHVVVMDSKFSKVSDASKVISFPSVDDLIKEGLSRPASFIERKLEPGEAKTKLAFLSFSSGTTGKPKVLLQAFST